MHRIRILALALIAVLACGALSASVASAAKRVLVLSTGAKEGALKAGEPIELSTTNLQFVTALGTYDCTYQNSFSGTLVSNAGTKSDPLDITGFSGGSCKSGVEETTTQVVGLPWTVALTPKGTAEVKSGGLVGFAMYFGSLGATCHFEAKDITGTFRPGTELEAEPLTIAWSGQTLKLAASDDVKCAAVKTATVSGLWNLSLLTSHLAVRPIVYSKIPCYIVHACPPPLNLYYDQVFGHIRETLVPEFSGPVVTYYSEISLENRHGTTDAFVEYSSTGTVRVNSEPTDEVKFTQTQFLVASPGVTVSGATDSYLAPSSSGGVSFVMGPALDLETAGSCVYEMETLTGTLNPPPGNLEGSFTGVVAPNKAKSLGTCKKDAVTGNFSVSTPQFFTPLETEVP